VCYRTEHISIFLVLAGHQTTSDMMTWALYNLASNPEVYRRCVDEVDSVMSIDNELTDSMLSLLTYTEAVLKESLRLYPPAPLLIRTAVADNTLVASDGKHIHVKKGTELALNLYMLHQ
jgi:cytochrome P450